MKLRKQPWIEIQDIMSNGVKLAKDNPKRLKLLFVALVFILLGIGLMGLTWKNNIMVASQIRNKAVSHRPSLQNTGASASQTTFGANIPINMTQSIASVKQTKTSKFTDSYIERTLTMLETYGPIPRDKLKAIIQHALNQSSEFHQESLQHMHEIHHWVLEQAEKIPGQLQRRSTLLKTMHDNYHTEYLDPRTNTSSTSGSDLAFPTKDWKEQWRRFASDFECDADLNYSRIVRSLDPWRGTGITKIMLDGAVSLLHRFHYDITKVVDGRISGMYTHYLAPVSQYLVSNCAFLINTLDEPRWVVDNCTDETRPRSRPDYIASYKDRNLVVSKVLKDACISSERVEVLEKGHGFFHKAETVSLIYEKIPVMSSAVVSGLFGDILIPSHFHYNFPRSTKPEPEWKDKKTKIVWRGSTTGGFDRDAWIKDQSKHFNHRLALVEKFGRVTSLVEGKVEVDIGLHDLIQCSPYCSQFQDTYSQYVKPKIAFEDHFDNKYLLDVDGNTFSRRRLAFHRSKSLVFAANVFETWFSDLVEPWKHYVPVEPNLSDLEDKLRWAVEHDAEAKQIAQASHDLAQKILKDEDMNCYWGRLAIEYSSLWKGGV